MRTECDEQRSGTANPGHKHSLNYQQQHQHQHQQQQQSQPQRQALSKMDADYEIYKNAFTVPTRRAAQITSAAS
ncbi:hypothetical protein AWZ03_009995 [Drosophila navojoa]|uniref:Uncharacterized protein n=1 Tax=Drosophila navojoa TaxID=7232 RepID=A0A484B4M5_DRONA|nr:hypothetical protein AWZ03_009995 [Drosophila navojoa]